MKKFPFATTASASIFVTETPSSSTTYEHISKMVGLHGRNFTPKSTALHQTAITHSLRIHDFNKAMHNHKHKNTILGYTTSF